MIWSLEVLSYYSVYIQTHNGPLICSCLVEFLNLPNRPILTEFLREDQHVVGMSIGNLSSTSFIDTLSDSVSSRYSLNASTVQFFIPMLTGPDPNGPLQYKVVLNSFVSTDKPFLQANAAIPTTQVEEIVLNENGLYMKDDDEYLHVSWRESEICKSLDHDVTDYVNEYTEELIVPYKYLLNFSACDDSEVQEVDLCRAYEELACTLSQNRFNACEYWALVDSLKMCKLMSYSVDAISSGFQAASLLSETDHIPVFSEIQSAVDFHGNLKVPCIDSIQDN